MKPSHFVMLFLVLILLVTGSGCAMVEGKIESARLSQMTVMERAAYKNKKRAVQDEKKLNDYFTTKQAEMESVASDADGLRTTHDIAQKVERDISFVRHSKGNNYTSPQMEEFAQQFRVTRNRQLQALHPLLADDSGNTSPQTSGYYYLIHSGIFSETRHPVYEAATLAQRRIAERNIAAAQRKKNEKRDQDIQSLGQIVNQVLAAKKKHSDDLKAKGLCPPCEGDGKIVITTENKCYSCTGPGGASFFNKGTCRICGGTGSVGIGKTELKDCTRCSGSGKYPPP